MDIHRIEGVLFANRIVETEGEAELLEAARYRAFFNDVKQDASIRSQLGLSTKHSEWRDFVLSAQARLKTTEPMYFGIFRKALLNMACAIERTDVIL